MTITAKSGKPGDAVFAFRVSGELANPVEIPIRPTE
jgi:hypothetical protein